MKYYIASGLENVAKVRELKKILDDAGWEHTYDWTPHGAVEVDQLPETAAAEADGVMVADVIIAMMPGGRGTHTELGMAIGHTQLAYVLQLHGVLEDVHRRIIVYSENPGDFAIKGQTSAFYHHPLVERVTSWEALLDTLLKR